jgi:hypothetical protein
MLKNLMDKKDRKIYLCTRSDSEGMTDKIAVSNRMKDQKIKGEKDLIIVNGKRKQDNLTA